jgi:hypothetical protein
MGDYYNQPHPYGVLPLGNMYFASATDQSVMKLGLGKVFRRMTEEALIDLLSFLDGSALSVMTSLSRAMYVYAHHSDLWRDLTLRKWENQPIKYDTSWKQTYMNMNTSLGSSVRHVPITVRGAYSALLHRAWTCHCCDLKSACPGFFKFSDIDRLNAASLSLKSFVEQYEQANKPVVISNAVQDWEALRIWSDSYLSALEKEDGQQKLFRATSPTAPVAAVFTLSDYFNYAKQSTEEAPLYLFERDFAKKIPILESQYAIPSYFSPAVENDSSMHKTDLFRVFGNDKRPDYRWMIVGPRRSGSIFHIDPNQTNAWNVSITGRKKWIFYPPGSAPPGVEQSEDGADVAVPISTGEWLLSFWSDHLERRKDPDISKRPLEIIVQPGEVIFVPHGYWHMVLNLDMCVALTHNYVSTSNLSDCLHFLKYKSDQISGIRDRSEAVSVHSIYNEFVAGLQSVLPSTDIQEYVNRSKEKERVSKKRTGLSSVGTVLKRRANEYRANITNNNASSGALSDGYLADSGTDKKRCKRNAINSSTATSNKRDKQQGFSFSFNF